MKLAILDGYSINPGDLSWEPLETFGTLTPYERSSEDEIPGRIEGCDGFFVSKCKITREIIKNCPTLKFIGVTATGYDNIDLEAAKEFGVAVYNVPAYSTTAVAQHVFSLILELTNHVGIYNQSIQKGKWYESKDFTFIEEPLMLLEGKSLGIVGYGNIGKRVAKIGEALGMKINIYSKDRNATVKSDFLTLHCPLTEENRGFINREFISQMKDGAILINTARGGLVNEEDLAAALKSGKLAAAGIDVISAEPPKSPHPLIGLPNCILTPHIAWMPKETRQRVIDICTDNLNRFLNDEDRNRIV